MNYTYAARLNRVKSILGGMTAYADKLAKWGITQNFITDMTTLYTQWNHSLMTLVLWVRATSMKTP
jgi:hypothetical protein